MRSGIVKSTAAAFVLILLLAACGPQDGDSGGDSLPGSDLEGTTWTMTSMAKTKPLPGAEITAGFMDGQIIGSTGCNNYFGSFETDGQKVAIENAGVTEMACMTPDGVMEQESRFLDYFYQVNRIHLSADELQLITSDGEYLIFVPRP